MLTSTILVSTVFDSILTDRQTMLNWELGTTSRMQRSNSLSFESLGMFLPRRPAYAYS